MSAYLENINISRGHALASTALILSVLAILFAVSMRATPCVSAASGSCSVGETETFAGDLGLGKDADIEYEGATENDFETTLTVTDPTADRTITFPDASGTVALAGGGAATVPEGGTGVTTLGANGVLVGDGANAVNVTAAGNAGEVLTSNGAGSDPTFQAGPSGGLAMIDQWRIHTDYSITQVWGGSYGDPVDYGAGSSFERNDTAGFGRVGTGMTLDTGTNVWSFTETGIYKISASFETYCYYFCVYAVETTKNFTAGSPTWTRMSEIYDGTYSQWMQNHGIAATVLFDVEDIAEDKLRFGFAAQCTTACGGGVIRGDTNVNRSWVMFEKVGDT